MLLPLRDRVLRKGNVAEFCYNFTKLSSLPPDLLCVRNSGQSYHDSTGTIKYVGVNEVVFDHQPISGIPIGILRESTVENRVEHSVIDNGGVNWTPSSIIFGGTTTSPDNTNTAIEISDGTATAPHFLLSSSTVDYVSGDTPTCSIYAEPNTATVLQIAGPSSAFGSSYANFNLATGEVGSVSGMTASIVPYPDGRFRCEATLDSALTAAGARAFVVALVNNDPNATRLASYTGTNQSLYIWGAQNEEAPFATSYIPTSGTAVTRERGTVRRSVTNIYNPAKGSMLVEFTGSINPTDMKSAMSFIGTAGASQNSMGLGINGYAGGTGALYIKDSGTVSVSLGTSRTLIRDETVVLGSTYTEDKATLSFNGTFEGEDTSVTLPTGVTLMGLGEPTDTASTHFRMHIQKACYWNNVIPNITSLSDPNFLLDENEDNLTDEYGNFLREEV